jgi:CheY-like chemotaxis protein
MTYHFDLPMVVHIDDDEDLLTLVGYALGSLSVRYLGLSSSRAGLETVRFLKPALVLLDIMMPDLDGWELLRLFKRDPNLGAMKVIVFSALEGNEPRQQALAGGADGYLSKPFPVDALCQLVSRVTGVAGTTRPLGELPVVMRLYSDGAALAPGEDQVAGPRDPLPAHVAAFVDQYCEILVDLEILSYLHDRTGEPPSMAEMVADMQRMAHVLALRLNRLTDKGMVARHGAGEAARYALAADAPHRQAWQDFFASCMQPDIRMYAVYRVAKRGERKKALRG